MNERRGTSIKHPLVTVVVPTFNREGSIGSCIKALLAQEYKNMEVIISDDCSDDGTISVVGRFRDSRLRLLKSTSNQGPSAARNKAILRAKGELIFFTDDDVIVPPDWISKGLKYFDNSSCIGIEGRIVYVSETFSPTYSDRIVENTGGKLYMTANAAYRAQAFKAVGLFDTQLKKYQDRDLAMKMMKLGNIIFAKDCQVIHQRELFTLGSYMREAAKIKYWMIHANRNHDNYLFWGPIYAPDKLAAIILPPLIIIQLFSGRKFSNPRDWALFLLLYPRLVLERVLIWKFSITNRKWVI